MSRLLLAVAFFAQAPPPLVMIQPASGYAPPAIVVTPYAHPNVQVCADFTSGMVSCRSVGEFREWVQVRPMYKK